MLIFLCGHVSLDRFLPLFSCFFSVHCMPPTHTVTEPAELLAFLFASEPAVKRTRVRQWLKFGSVHVNGESITLASHPLQVGDVVTVEPKGDGRLAVLLPKGMQVLFEDAGIIVIDKPENLLSMGTDKEKDKTAYAYLNNYIRRGNARNPNHVWIVHRLDRETSGVMVFAKTEAAKAALQQYWDDVVKHYLAIVEGAPPEDEGVFSSHLNENGPYKVYSAQASEQTRLAVTPYFVLKKTATRALVELMPETGRRNQIRVHLADAGCPIVGDQKYGAKTNPIRRVALHASVLQFKHPVTGKLMRFESKLPRALDCLT
jgi:23S rRNA pseudouridine1911/1915/1917 synthase